MADFHEALGYALDRLLRRGEISRGRLKEDLGLSDRKITQLLTYLRQLLDGELLLFVKKYGRVEMLRILGEDGDFAERKRQNWKEKRRIGRYIARELIEDTDRTIALVQGTTLFAFALELLLELTLGKRADKKVRRLITNNLAAIQCLQHRVEEVICAGKLFSAEDQCFLGEGLVEGFTESHVDVALVSFSSLSEDGGVWIRPGRGGWRKELTKALLSEAPAEKVIIALDSSKIGCKQGEKVGRLSDLIDPSKGKGYYLVTDPEGMEKAKVLQAKNKLALEVRGPS
jgi:DeoR/GlpR family transcriptional regulator of sugar metabolism